MAIYTVRFLPGDVCIQAAAGENLLEAARKAGVHPNAPCGGRGTCGKCLARLEHTPEKLTVKACQTAVTEDMTVRFLSELKCSIAF